MINFDYLKDSISLEGKVAIATGASRPNGQGKQVALLLAMRGAQVVVTDVADPDPGMSIELSSSYERCRRFLYRGDS